MDKTRRVAQACDACKLRKVKCNGQERCQQCSHLDLKCIYSAVRAQRRTSQKRGRLISEYKKSTAAATGSFPASHKPTLDAASLRRNSPPSAALAATTVTSPTVPISSNGHKHGNHSIASIDSIITNRNDKNNNDDHDGVVNPPYSPSTSSTLVYSQNFFLALVPAYIAVVYPLNPVISEVELRESIANMSHDREHAALAYAAAAVTMNLTRSGSGRGNTDISSDISQIKQLITKAIELAGCLHLDTRLTIRRIMIPMFLHNCLMTLQKIDLAFFYLREALSMMQMMRVGSAEMLAKSQFDLPERARRERLYWLAFVHERFLSIVDYRPAILTPLSELPEHDPNIPDGVHEGFNQIIKLFRLVDGDFLHNWLGSHSDSGLTTAWIEQKQKELDDEDDYLLLGNNSADAREEADDGTHIGSNAAAGAVPGGKARQSPGTTRLTDMQQADLIITRQWLRTVVWQMAMSRCLLSSGASKECMSLLFPVRLSHQLRFLITSMSRDAIEIHGCGILKKLFELADTIADVIIHVPIASIEETTARVDDFLFLIRFLFTFPRFDPFEKEILREKLRRLQALFPYIQGQDHERDQNRHHNQGQAHSQTQNHNHQGSAGADGSGSVIHHQNQHSPCSIDGTASTITVIGTDSTTNPHSNAMMNVPAQAPLPSPILSLATTSQQPQQQYRYHQSQQHQSPISAAVTPVSSETSPNIHSNPNSTPYPNPKPYPNPWLDMTRTVLYNRTDPSFVVNLAPSPPPSSNSAASVDLSSPTLSSGGMSSAHTQAQNEFEPVPVPTSSPNDIMEMARGQSQTQTQVRTQLQPMSDVQGQGKPGIVSTSAPGAGPGSGQGLMNAKWHSMTRRLSMAR